VLHPIMMEASEIARMILFIQCDLKINPKLLHLRNPVPLFRRMATVKVALNSIKTVKAFIIWQTN